MMTPQICFGHASDGLLTSKNFILLQLPSMDTIEATTELSKSDL